MIILLKGNELKGKAYLNELSISECGLLKIHDKFACSCSPPTKASVLFGRDNTFYLVWDSFVNVNIIVVVLLGLSQLDNTSVPCWEVNGGWGILASWKACEIIVISPCSS